MLQRPPTLTPLYKTRPCTFYAAGRCSAGPLCSYAHGDEDLRPAPTFDKTSVCPVLMGRGVCRKPGCRYAHSSEELKASPTLLKTKMCSFFFSSSGCVVGAACRFAHDAQELQEAATVEAVAMQWAVHHVQAAGYLAEDTSSGSPPPPVWDPLETGHEQHFSEARLPRRVAASGGAAHAVGDAGSLQEPLAQLVQLWPADGFRDVSLPAAAGPLPITQELLDTPFEDAQRFDHGWEEECFAEPEPHPSPDEGDGEDTLSPLLSCPAEKADESTGVQDAESPETADQPAGAPELHGLMSVADPKTTKSPGKEEDLSCAPEPHELKPVDDAAPSQQPENADETAVPMPMFLERPRDMQPTYPAPNRAKIHRALLAGLHKINKVQLLSTSVDCGTMDVERVLFTMHRTRGKTKVVLGTDACVDDTALQIPDGSLRVAEAALSHASKQVGNITTKADVAIEDTADFYCQLGGGNCSSCSYRDRCNFATCLLCGGDGGKSGAPCAACGCKAHVVLKNTFLCLPVEQLFRTGSSRRRNKSL